MNNSIAVVYTILVIITPPLGYMIIARNLEQLSSRSVRARYGTLYADNRTDTKERALYNIYFLTRRFFTVLVLVFMV